MLVLWYMGTKIQWYYEDGVHIMRHGRTLLTSGISLYHHQTFDRQSTKTTTSVVSYKLPSLLYYSFYSLIIA